MKELPADITAGIDALEAWHEDTLRGYATENYDTIRAALDAAILKHLEAAKNQPRAPHYGYQEDVPGGFTANMNPPSR